MAAKQTEGRMFDVRRRHVGKRVAIYLEGRAAAGLRGRAGPRVIGIYRVAARTDCFYLISDSP